MGDVCEPALHPQPVLDRYRHDLGDAAKRRGSPFPIPPTGFRSSQTRPRRCQRSAADRHFPIPPSGFRPLQTRPRRCQRSAADRHFPL